MHATNDMYKSVYTQIPLPGEKAFLSNIQKVEFI